MMLRSGNDAATAVAEAIGGDTETFAAMMNERAASLGLRNSHLSIRPGFRMKIIILLLMIWP